MVSFDRFTSAGRSCVRGPVPVPAMQPWTAVGCYRSWAAVGHPRALAWEDRIFRRDCSTKHQWLTALANDVLKSLRDAPARPLFAAWFTDAVLRQLADATGAQILTIVAETRRRLEDKTQLECLLRAADVPAQLRIPAVVVSQPPAYREIVARLGPRLVVQPAQTSGGRGTIFVADETSFRQAMNGQGPWRISTFVDGYSSNTTVLTVPVPGGCAVYVDQPSHKPVGIPDLGIAAAKGAGNDWFPSWPTELTEGLVEAVVRLGRYLFAFHGLVGLWGVDAIWSPDGVVINEINVRNQGTTELSGVNQNLRGLPPLLVAHLTVMAGGTVSWLPPPQVFNAETVRRSDGGHPAPFYIKIRNPDSHSVAPIGGWAGPGVYRLDGDRLVFTRVGAHPADANLDAGETLLANVPGADVTCAPGAELGTAEGLTTRPVFAGPHHLSPLGARIHRAALRCFAAHPFEGSLS
jgi:hypothetical protein